MLYAATALVMASCKGPDVLGQCLAYARSLLLCSPEAELDLESLRCGDLLNPLARYHFQMDRHTARVGSGSWLWVASAERVCRQGLPSRSAVYVAPMANASNIASIDEPRLHWQRCKVGDRIRWQDAKYRPCGSMALFAISSPGRDPLVKQRGSAFGDPKSGIDCWALKYPWTAWLSIVSFL
ncbi:hypothetical protein CFAM422_003355 [Trichoderma lentiforme]|uniref:Uncharacterized protein n=1 Tax=Trichoderma lentiforme TaxID=1567552 RepID=A0A9P5CEB3_9HYPO|nr:hypothetical protein CFAM422_003355 [Trichoderma lentiforme]